MSNTNKSHPASTSTVPFRPFEKSDWMAFSGAEDLAPGVSPMIAYTDEVVYILSGNGLEAIFEEESFHHDQPATLTSYPCTPDAARAAGWEQLT